MSVGRLEPTTEMFVSQTTSQSSYAQAHANAALGAASWHGVSGTGGG